MFNNNALIEESDKLKKFAFKLTHNQADAEDLLQTTLLRAIEKKHLFEKDTNLFSWTSKIMYNLFVTAYRRKIKFETQYDPETIIANQSVAANQDTNMEFKEMNKAMDEISEEHREILILVCVKGMQYAEASELLQIPVGTVRSRLSRARESLQMALELPKINLALLSAYDNKHASAST